MGEAATVSEEVCGQCLLRLACIAGWGWGLGVSRYTEARSPGGRHLGPSGSPGWRTLLTEWCQSPDPTALLWEAKGPDVQARFPIQPSRDGLQFQWACRSQKLMLRDSENWYNQVLSTICIGIWTSRGGPILFTRVKLEVDFTKIKNI